MRLTGNRFGWPVAGACLAAMLVLAVTGRPAWAYFTSQSWASGSLLVQGPSTDITERYGNATKSVVITNDKDSVPVYVRARVFSSLPCEVSGVGWDDAGDGWYTYGPVVEPGSKTEELTVKISFPLPDYDNPDATEDGPVSGEQHNVVVVYEALPVTYDADGVAQAVSWPVGGGA